MHSAGVVRKIDDLGRVSIPKELRQQYRWKHGDEVEFFIDGKELVLRKVTSIEDKLEELTDIYCKACWGSVQAHCIICTVDKIVASSCEDIYKPGQLVSPFFKKHLLKHGAEGTTSATTKSMPKITSYDQTTDMIMPLTYHGQVIGAMVMPHLWDEVDRSTTSGFCALASALQRQLDA